MKKLILTIIMLIIPIITFAEGEINVPGMVEAINNGDITNQFKKEQKKLQDEVTIQASETPTGLIINATYTQNSSYTIEMNIDLEKGYLVTTREFDADKVEDDLVKIYKLIPLWGIESSSYYDQIKAFRVTGDDYISFLNKIFDKCYMEEYGICYTTDTHYEITTIKAQVELTNKGPKYAIKQLKILEDERDESKFMTICVVIIAVIGPIFLIMLKNSDRERAKRTTLSNKFLSK